MEIGKIKPLTQIQSLVRFIYINWFYIRPVQFWNGVRLFVMIILGALILSPLVRRLPMLGWDWYFFFNRHNPDFNILSPASAYPPYASFLLYPLTWMNWRTSLSILNSITLVTIAVATWRNHGGYVSVIFALLSPPVWFLLWLGHPDGLCLLGLITGVIPVALIKPQLTIFSMLSNKKLLAWTGVFMLVTLMIWPFWPMRLGQAGFDHPAAFGWVNTGWPILIFGLILLCGAGKNPYRLMAAGLLTSPYLMPYNLAVLIPALGSVKGSRKLLLWSTAWLTLLGSGMTGPAKYLNLVFPITVYLLNHSMKDYVANVSEITSILIRYSKIILRAHDTKS